MTAGAAGVVVGLFSGLLSGCVEVPVNSLNGSHDMRQPNGNGDLGKDMAQNTGPAWRWESPQPQGNNLRALWGIPGASADQDQVYAGGDNGVLLVGGSGGWQLQRSGSQDQRAILGIAGQTSGTPQVLAVGFFDLALRRSGTQWTDISPVLGTGDGALTSAWATSAAGEYFVVGTTGRMYHVLSGGSSWMREGAGVTPDSLFGVAGTGSGGSADVYAVGANGRIVHRLGGNWMVEADNLISSQLNSVWIGDGAASGEIFAVGDSSTVLHKQGGAWAVEKPPGNAQLTAVWGSGGDVYAVGAGGTVLHRKGGTWQPEAAGLTTELLTALWGTVRGGKITLYAAGNLGTLLRLDAGQWQSLSSRVTTSSLSGVWARNPGEVYVIGSDGLIMRRSGTAAQGAWSTVASGVTNAALNAITGWAASASAEAEVYAVGASGAIVHKSGTTWSIDGGFLTTQELTGVWTNQDSVWVVGRGGRIYHKLKGTWTIELGPMGVPVKNDLFSVWGTGVGNGEVVYVSGDQGLVLRHDMLGWTQETSGLTTMESLVSLFGNNEDNLYVYGNKSAVFRRLGGKWGATTTGPIGRGVAGTSGSVLPGSQDLLAIGDQGAIVRRSGGNWLVETSLTSLPFSGISAASLTDYYVVGSSGLILHKY